MYYLPLQKSFVIYEYKCHCDSRYVGQTSQRLQNRIKQHVSQWLRQQLTRPRRSQPHRSYKRNDTKPDYDSAIGQHLLENDQCALNYNNKPFSTLGTARSTFHLNLLDAAYIETQYPVLCRQKEFVYALKLFRQSRRLASFCTFSNFRYCETFFIAIALYNTRAIICSSYDLISFLYIYRSEYFLQAKHLKHKVTFNICR